jgi:hypothetical protein
MRRILLTSLLLTAALSGCDMLGDSAEKIAAAKEAEGKAVGGACRHAGRAIEDCYALNKKADKASVFAGWRDMNDYMRENKIDAVPPQLAGGRADAKVAEAKTDEKSEAKPEAKEGKPVEGAAAIEKRPAKLVQPVKIREAKGHES